MLTNDNLRFIDENTFQEAEPPEDRSRPLEWKRSFNTVGFKVSSPKVEYVYTVNDVDHFADIQRGQAQESNPIVTASARRRVRVTFELQQDKLRDSILYTKETEKKSGLYQLVRTKEPFQISLTDAAPTEPRGPYAQGAYPGLAFKTDFEPGEDALCIEVGAPSDQLEEIANAINNGQANAMHVAVGVQSFSYEVDDALGEWYHPRDLFIHGSAAQAVLLSVRLIRRDPEPQPIDEIAESEEDAPVVVPPPPTVLPDYRATLRSIKTALWVVAGLLLLQLFK